MNIDLWQLMGSIAALCFTFGFVDQVRVTYKTKCVEGVSKIQWMMFSSASVIFFAYYVHLEQWMMVGVSILGTACCLSILIMVFMYKKESEAQA